MVKNSNPTVLFASIKMAFKLYTAHQKIRESENSYRQLVEGSPDIVYQFSSKRGGVFYSAQVEKVLGYTRDQLYAQPFLWNESIHPDDLTRIAKTIQEFESGTPFEIEYRIRDVHGKWHWLRDRSIGRYQKDGEILLEGLASDLTEQKLTQEILQEKTNELDRYFMSSLDLFCIADMDGYFRHLNKEWERTLGYSIQELEGKSFLDFVHPDDLASTMATMNRLDAQTPVINFENRYRCKDGRYRWIEWRSMPQGNFIYAAARDVTGRKEVEEQLHKSEEQYRSVIGAMHEGVIVQDQSGRIITANPAASRILSLSSAELLGNNLLELGLRAVHEDGSAYTAEADPVRNTLRTGIPQSNEIIGFYKSDQTVSWISINTHPVWYGDPHQPSSVVTTFSDISDALQIEKDLRES